MNKYLCNTLVVVILTLVTSSCTRVGPDMMYKDRFDYTTAVGDSWKEQVLLNIVRIRYSDWPTFVAVDQIITAYTMEHSGTAKLVLRRGISDVLTNDQAEAGWIGKFAERPTVLYKPLSGQKYVNALLTPAKASSILALITSGWPADHLSRVAIRSVNDHFNSNAEQGFMYRTDTEFASFVKMLKVLQRANALKIVLQQQEDDSKTLDLVFVPEKLNVSEQERLQELKVALGIDPALNSYHVVRDMMTVTPDSLRIQGRSLLQVLVAMSTGVDIPEAHLQSGEAPPLEPLPEHETTDLAKLMTVKSGPENPGDAYVAVKYSGMWFWIDKRDHFSKRSLQYALTLITILDSAESAGGTVVIPAN